MEKTNNSFFREKLEKQAKKTLLNDSKNYDENLNDSKEDSFCSWKFIEKIKKKIPIENKLILGEKTISEYEKNKKKISNKFFVRRSFSGNYQQNQIFSINKIQENKKTFEEKSNKNKIKIKSVIYENTNQKEKKDLILVKKREKLSERNKNIKTPINELQNEFIFKKTQLFLNPQQIINKNDEKIEKAKDFKNFAKNYNFEDNNFNKFIRLFSAKPNIKKEENYNIVQKDFNEDYYKKNSNCFIAKSKNNITYVRGLKRSIKNTQKKKDLLEKHFNDFKFFANC